MLAPGHFPNVDCCCDSCIVDEGFSPNCARMAAAISLPEIGPGGVPGCWEDVVGVYEARGAS